MPETPEPTTAEIVAGLRATEGLGNAIGLGAKLISRTKLADRLEAAEARAVKAEGRMKTFLAMQAEVDATIVPDERGVPNLLIRHGIAYLSEMSYEAMAEDGHNLRVEVAELNADRDRLRARVEQLERDLKASLLARSEGCRELMAANDRIRELMAALSRGVTGETAGG